MAMFKFKAVPWLLVLAALRVLYEHWQRVEERDRKRATEILVEVARPAAQDGPAGARRISSTSPSSLDHIALGRDLADAATPFPVPGLKSKKSGKR